MDSPEDTFAIWKRLTSSGVCNAYSRRLVLYLISAASAGDIADGSSVVVPITATFHPYAVKKHTPARAALMAEPPLCVESLDMVPRKGDIIVKLRKGAVEDLRLLSSLLDEDDLYAMRFVTGAYSADIIAMVAQRSLLSKSLADLREAWSLTDNYEKSSNMLEKTFVNARYEMERYAPWSFHYKRIIEEVGPLQKRHPGRPAFAFIEIEPLRLPANRRSFVRRQCGFLPEEVLRHFVAVNGFRPSDLVANAPVLRQLLAGQDAVRYARNSKARTPFALMNALHGFVIRNERKGGK